METSSNSHSREKFNTVIGLLIPVVCVYFGWLTALTVWYWVLLGISIFGLIFFTELLEFVKTTDQEKHKEFMEKTYTLSERMFMVGIWIIHMGIIFMFMNNIPLLITYVVVFIWGQFNITKLNKSRRNNIL